MQQVIIASQNPVKINATQRGFERMFPKQAFSFSGISVPSGVADQPMSNEETLQGAKNRVLVAKKELPSADFWVGIEGGIQLMGQEMEAFAWVVIHSASLSGKSRTATFFLPPKVVELILAGKELGEADDIVFGQNNSKQKGGAVGILTNNIANRTSYYEEAVILALIPFCNETLFLEG